MDFLMCDVQQGNNTKRTAINLTQVQTFDEQSEYGEGHVTVTLQNGNALSIKATMPAVFQLLNNLGKATGFQEVAREQHEELRQEFIRANDALRSFAQVAKRHGENTAWPSLQAALNELLKEQHAFMLRQKMFAVDETPAAEFAVKHTTEPAAEPAADVSVSAEPAV